MFQSPQEHCSDYCFQVQGAWCSISSTRKVLDSHVPRPHPSTRHYNAKPSSLTDGGDESGVSGHDTKSSGRFKLMPEILVITEKAYIHT